MNKKGFNSVDILPIIGISMLIFGITFFIYAIVTNEQEAKLVCESHNQYYFENKGNTAVCSDQNGNLKYWSTEVD
jgi:hypothetical protein